MSKRLLIVVTAAREVLLYQRKERLGSKQTVTARLMHRSYTVNLHDEKNEHVT